MEVSAVQTELEKSIDHLQQEMKHVRTGRATPDIVEHVFVESYGTKTPLKGLASITVSDSKTLVIQPWDKGLLSDIEKAIQTSDIGINPVNDGSLIRLVLPELNEERRKSLVKQVSLLGEEAKVAMRNIRHKAMDDIKKADSSEDETRGREEEVENLIKEFGKKVDDVTAKKEEDLMKV